jgi:hypothetical protein
MARTFYLFYGIVKRTNRRIDLHNVFVLVVDVHIFFVTCTTSDTGSEEHSFTAIGTVPTIVSKGIK